MVGVGGIGRCIIGQVPLEWGSTPPSDASLMHSVCILLEFSLNECHQCAARESLYVPESFPFGYIARQQKLITWAISRLPHRSHMYLDLVAKN